MYVIHASFEDDIGTEQHEYKAFSLKGLQRLLIGLRQHSMCINLIVMEPCKPEPIFWVQRKNGDDGWEYLIRLPDTK